MLSINYSIKYILGEYINEEFTQILKNLVSINSNPNTNLYQEKIKKRKIYFNLIL